MRFMTTALMGMLLGLVVAGQAFAQESAGPFAAFDLAGPTDLNDPHDLAIGPDGRIYVADKFGNRIAVLDPETLEIVEIIADGKLPGVHDISFGPDGRAVVAVTGLGMVIVFDRITDPDLQPSQILRAPRTEGALIHPNGNIYAMAGGIGAVLTYRDGEIIATAGGHFGAHDIALDLAGNIWVADNANRRLVKYSPELERLRVLDHPKFGFVGPRYLDIDDFGRLLVADQDAHRILMIDPDGPDGGTLIGVLGNGTPGKGPGLFDDPEGILVVGSRYYISDSDNNRIVRYEVVMN
jgi:DNA-binding beta-propeller fold protein YncE